MVLSEPETSLHPELLRPLADLVVAASRTAQVVMVSHSAPLVALIEAAAAPDDLRCLERTKEFGETKVVWKWPEH